MNAVVNLPGRPSSWKGAVEEHFRMLGTRLTAELYKPEATAEDLAKGPTPPAAIEQGSDQK